MRIWFWAWLLVAVLVAAVSAVFKDRFSAPWAAGAACAAGLEALRVAPGWQWGAFLGMSAVVFVLLNWRPRYAPRHTRRKDGQPS
ncbi:MAG TPA: hypothetical protein VF902_09905 [Coriobacteriia bacterium]